jgi:Domain of unknown function (DUF4416)
MGETRQREPVMLVVAAFSRHAELLELGRRHLEDRYGPVALASEPYEFNQTGYYAPTMGMELRKQFFAFRDFVMPDQLASIKLAANELERTIIAGQQWPEARPLNLDPGILTLGKFLLATTKDQSHRIYLRDGIFAEVTLRFQAGKYVPWPWTYADYRLPAVLEFLGQAREYYYQHLRQETS